MRNKMSSNVNVMEARKLKPNILYFLRRIPQWRRFGSGGGSMEASLACDSPSLLGSWRAVWKSHEKNTSFLWWEVRKVFFWANELSSQNESGNACVSKPEAPWVLLAPLPGLLAWASRAPCKETSRKNEVSMGVGAKGLAWVLVPCFWQSAWEHLFWVICSPKTQW